MAKTAPTHQNFSLGRTRRSLLRALLDARAEHGGGKVAVVDADGRTMTYDQLILAAFALGSALKKGTQKGEKIGVLLPTGVGVLVTFFGLHAYGRVPAMLNFTSGVANLRTAARTAPFTKIITARQFIEIGKLDDLIMGLKDHVEIIYLEDIRPKLNIVDKLRGAVGSQLGWLVRSFPSPDEPGVVLFTSGTEGTPKGVVLSHANVVANVEQVRAHVALRTDDVVFNPLPTFHCFGLTGGALLPLFAGMKAVLHPSPLQFKVIPKRIRETGSTILFATDTFLSQYARAGDQGDMNNLRFTVCGAERVRDETRQLVRTKYNMDVLEGYGATEAAPVLAVNQPENNRPGTVGQLLPGIEHKLIPVEGIAEGGRLVVRGPNVMQGYILAEQPGVIQPPQDGWHDTGDVVTLDAEGYVTIRGRVKRFAKIGGEMVSLAVVENCAAAIWPDNMHAAVAIPDTRKGEQIVLLTDSAVANRQEILAWAQSHGVPELAVPRKVFFSDGIPVLGTGKIDYSMVTRLALAAKEQPEPLAS